MDARTLCYSWVLFDQRHTKLLGECADLINIVFLVFICRSSPTASP